MTLSSLFTDDVGTLPLLAIAGGGLAICYVHYLGENDPGWKGFIANILRIVGGVAFLITIAVVFSTVIAAILAVAAVLLFMAPLFVLGGASGLADRRPLPWARNYHRTGYHHRNDYY